VPKQGFTFTRLRLSESEFSELTVFSEFLILINSIILQIRIQDLRLKMTHKDSIQFLNTQLGLPATGTEQDWEIEMANPQRISQFIDFYTLPYVELLISK
jgi:hypothetical protein